MAQQRIYLDHAATSPLRPEARAAMEAPAVDHTEVFQGIVYPTLADMPAPSAPPLELDLTQEGEGNGSDAGGR